MRDHTKIRAFELADEVAMIIYQVTREFPNSLQPNSLSLRWRATCPGVETCYDPASFTADSPSNWFLTDRCGQF